MTLCVYVHASNQLTCVKRKNIFYSAPCSTLPVILTRVAVKSRTCTLHAYPATAHAINANHLFTPRGSESREGGGGRRRRNTRRLMRRNHCYNQNSH